MILTHLKTHLKGKVIVLGIGNTLKSDDGVGSILARRIKDRAPFLVWDAGSSPENYLGRIIREKPDALLIIDAVDFGGKPGEFNLLEGSQLKTVNLFSTHDASLELVINYLQNNLVADIIILMIQPGTLVFGDKLSPQIDKTIGILEEWFCRKGIKIKG